MRETSLWGKTILDNFAEWEVNAIVRAFINSVQSGAIACQQQPGCIKSGDIATSTVAGSLCSTLAAVPFSTHRARISKRKRQMSSLPFGTFLWLLCIGHRVHLEWPRMLNLIKSVQCVHYIEQKDFTAGLEAGVYERFRIQKLIR